MTDLRRHRTRRTGQHPAPAACATHTPCIRGSAAGTAQPSRQAPSQREAPGSGPLASPTMLARRTAPMAHSRCRAPHPRSCHRPRHQSGGRQRSGGSSAQSVAGQTPSHARHRAPASQPAMRSLVLSPCVRLSCARAAARRKLTHMPRRTTALRRAAIAKKKESSLRKNKNKCPTNILNNRHSQARR